jgi:uncharacterized BrkB/YihY/UPF0761 family membrane protein
MAQHWQQGIRSAHRLNERTHGWLGVLAGATREALKPNSPITAAAIAYFALFSLFPITLLSISISFVSTYISVSNLVYGSVAAIIAFLVWAYLSGLIFLFSAYLSVSYFQLKQQQKETMGEIRQ